VAPFRLKPSNLAAHSSFLQLNWVFDAFFVRKEVALGMTEAGITGVSYGPALDHRTGDELVDRVQMCLGTVSCAETSRLPHVTCRQNNEEYVTLMAKFPNSVPASMSHPPETPFCGRVKHHQPTSFVIHPDAIENAPDLFQTEEWFGSGCEAHRLTLASERFIQLTRERGWRGLQFDRARQEGFSERDFRVGVN
jgi:hypothetical protein